ncbi:MAG TPA: hypothetical protein VIV11_04115 [Kofleriaceae bacterium]
MKGLLYLVLACGCATAGREEVVGGRPDGGGGGGGGSGTGKDAMVEPLPDAAPLPDAPPGMQQVTLSQTTNNTMAVGLAIACSSSILNVPIGTRDNSWYRVFKLSDYGIAGAFNVQRVTFYSDYAWGGTGVTQPATVKIGTYAGTLEADTLTVASITPITSKPITIPDADSSDGVDPPVITDLTATIPAGANLLVEIALPDGYNDGNFFYIGVSAGGETKKGYIRATPAGCNMTAPKSLTSATGINRPDNSILLTVTGTAM